MTKEELKKEAEELYEDWYAHKLGAISIIGVICKMAEPREKQIEIDAEQIRNLQKQNGELTDRVRELEAQIEKMKRCEICANSGDWRNRSKCIACEKSKSHINFELRR